MAERVPAEQWPADVGHILDALPPDGPQVVLIDGFSGAGKSTIADLVVPAWAERSGIRPQLVRLELLYPGWDGLAAASEQILRGVLEPIAIGRTGVWRRWDWTADAAAESHAVDARIPLVIEGVGALTRANRALAGLGVWVELDEQTRRRRALDRDGDTYRPHWERWAAQERRFVERENPRALADFAIDGRRPGGDR